MSVEGGEAMEFAGGLANTSGKRVAAISFFVTANGVYYLSRVADQRGAEIRFVAHTGGESKVVGSIPRNPSVGLSLSPDGRYLLYSQYDQSSAELMLVENFH